jgi:ribose transport system permease protein
VKLKNIFGLTVVKTVLNYGIYLLLILICLILALTTPTFLTVENILNVLLQTCIVGVVAVGMTFVIASDGIDLSVGAVMAVSSAVGVGAIKILGAPWWLGMLAMPATGLIFGCVNGISVAYIGIPEFLATLSTMSIARGLVLVLSGGKSWFNLPEQFAYLAAATFLRIPVLICVVILLYITFHIVLKHTIYGRKILCVGSNMEASRVSGINVKRVKMSPYLLCGAIVGIAAILQTARLNAFWAAMGSGLEFQAIAGVVIGGTSLKGGSGTLLGTLAGVLLMGIINNALNLTGVPANWQEVARGVIIFLAVTLDAIRNRFNVAD